MDFASDKNVWNIGDQYMFGPSLMVCPVYEYKARSREVYLPESNGWYDAYNGDFYTGGQKIEAVAPYEKMPLFVKAGSIIPGGPDMQFTSEKATDPLTVNVYAGDDGHFDLYEDEETNYNYENGAFSVIPLEWNEADGELVIGDRQGEFEGMLKERTIRVVYNGKNAFNDLMDPGKNFVEVAYSGKEIKVSLK